MISATRPFTPERHPVGVTRGGSTLTLEPMSPPAATLLAPAIAAFGPWAHYNLSADTLRNSFLVTGDGTIRYQLSYDNSPAGAVIICSPWLAGPYLQMLAVLPAFQGQGIGGHVLEWYQATAISARMRNVWLCVSGFNTRAQNLYRRHGFVQAGDLPSLIRDGDDELLMRKDLSSRLPPKAS